MPDIDPLAFGIRFALTHQTIGREARKLIRSLTEDSSSTCAGKSRSIFGCAAGNNGRPSRLGPPINIRFGLRGSAVKTEAKVSPSRSGAARRRM
jgi:hypothetical protein